MVVWLASFPRSGVTFLRHVIEQVYDLKTWTIYRSESSTTEGQDCLWPYETDGTDSVYFVKAHPAHFASTTQPAIHLVRDGRDALISYAHYLRYIGDTRPVAELIEYALTGADVFDHWGLHTMAWAARDVPRIVFSDLITVPVETVCHAVGQLDLGLEPNTAAPIKTFAELHEARPEFYRSGRAGGWREVLNPTMQNAFWSIHGSAQRWLEALCQSRRSKTIRCGHEAIRTCATEPPPTGP